MITVVFKNDGYETRKDVSEINKFIINEQTSIIEAEEQKDIINNISITFQWKSPDYHGRYSLKLGEFNLYTAYLEIDKKKFTYSEMAQNIEKAKAIIEQEKVKLALETLA